MSESRSLIEATRRVQLLMMLLLILCGGIGTGAAFLLRNAIQKEEAVTALMRSHMTADMMHDAVRGDVLSILASRDPAFGIDGPQAREDLRGRLETFRQSVAETASYPNSPAVTTATRGVAGPLDAYARAALTIAQLSSRDPEAAGRALPQFFVRFEELEEAMEKVTEVIESHGAEQSRRASWLGLSAIVLIVVAMGAAITLVTRIAAGMRSGLIMPIVGLATVIERMAAGDRAQAVEGADRGDEVGTLARGIADFRAQLEASEAAREQQSELIVKSIGSGLAALAEGNLSRSIETELHAPFASLKSDFNNSLTSLSGIVGEVRDSAGVVRLSAREIAEANGEIARRTERNAATLEETSAALNEIDRHVRDTAATATQTVEVANSGMASLVEGRSTTGSVVSAMNRVSDSAQGIDAVIEGLDKIAFQTRVLAMNAAVEAGRAGEAGRGFAVVADLVSALAMRAEEEAKLARAQLTTTQSDIGDAVEAVRSVDRALNEIAGNVEAVHGRLGAIAEANGEQANLISQIREAIEAMNTTTQQSAAMVEESAAAASQLTEQAEVLSRASGRFVLPTGPAALPAVRLAA